METKKLSKANRAIIRMIKEGYTVNELGEVFSPKGRKVGSKGCDGYILYSFRPTREENPVQILLHRFVGYKKYGDAIFSKGIQCRHLNDVKDDNRPDNICIGTAKDNYNDSIRNNIKRRKNFNKIELIESKHTIGFNNTVKKYGVSKEYLRQVLKC